MLLSTTEDVCVRVVVIGTVSQRDDHDRQGAVTEDLLRVVREIVRGTDQALPAP